MIITILTFVWATKHFRQRQPVVDVVSAAAAAVVGFGFGWYTGSNRIPAKIGRSLFVSLGWHGMAWAGIGTGTGTQTGTGSGLFVRKILVIMIARL